MKLLSLLITSLFFYSNAFAKTFGDQIPKTEKAYTISQLKSQLTNGKSPERVLAASTEKVCKKKGCWMSIKDGDQSIRIKFKNYGFFVPKDYDNKKFLAFGQLQQKEVSEKDRKHYLKDAKASKEEIAAVKGSSIEYIFIASGVEFL
ncbi:MAG: DUF4920 domain-containing protein [Bdellovibrionales bacterium]